MKGLKQFQAKEFVLDSAVENLGKFSEKKRIVDSSLV